MVGKSPSRLLSRCTGAFLVALVAAMATPLTSPSAAEPRLFGALSLAAENLTALPQWTDALGRWQQDEDARQTCLRQKQRGCEALRETVWRSRIDGLSTLPFKERLRQANALINGLIPVIDKDGREISPTLSGDAPGPWPTPREAITGAAKGSLAQALTKFATLRLAGTPNDVLRIVVARDVLRDHPVYLVAATIDGRFYILDSMNDSLREAQDAALYIPLYSFNETTRWFHLRPGQGQPEGESRP